MTDIEIQLIEFESKLNDIMNNNNIDDFVKQNRIIKLLQEYSIEEYKSNPILQSKIIDIFNNIFKKRIEYDDTLLNINSDIKKKEENEKIIKEKNKIKKIDDKNLIDLKIDVILKRTKDTLLEVLDEFLENKLTPEGLVKNNRGFFLGICIIFTLLLMYFFYLLIVDDNNTSNGNGIQITYNN